MLENRSYERDAALNGNSCYQNKNLYKKVQSKAFKYIVRFNIWLFK